MRRRPFLVLNSIGALWLAFGAISAQFNWPRFSAFPLSAFPLIGGWLGEAIAAIWVAAANVILGFVLLVLHAAGAHRA